MTTAEKIFPFPYSIDDLPNRLRLITIPTSYQNIVALYIVVQTGSRNEVEPGRSGFAHLFEHLMFRGTEKYPADAYDEILKNAGADHNAYTTDDRTVYHITFSREDLDTMLMLEADRFQRLKVPEDLFKVETRAVLGEYNKNASNPINKLLEVTRDTAFETHTYKHTTMGFLRDVENMPSMYDYSLEFFSRYYRPEYTTIVLAGDVTRKEALSSITSHWGGWEPGHYVVEVPAEPEQTAERTAHIDWPGPTLPWLLVAYKGPAYSDEQKDMAVVDLISALGLSENSDLYQQLVVKEQKVDVVFPLFEDHRDPYLLMAAARVKDPRDVDYVKSAIISAFDSFKMDTVPEQRLEDVRSHVRYSFALRMDNSNAVASQIASYVALRRTPETVNKLFGMYSGITASDIKGAAGKYFGSDQRTVVTLT